MGQDASGGGRLINARAETVAVKPAFRRAFARRCCILPADGYYEWQVVTEQGKQRKQPYDIFPNDGGSLAFAGAYELWRDETRPADDDGAWLWTAAIITTQATDDVGQIHDRMPMVITPDHWADWLTRTSPSPASSPRQCSPPWPAASRRIPFQGCQLRAEQRTRLDRAAFR